MTELNHIKAAESQLQRLLDDSDREALAESLRLLALYVASFKERYGELDATWAVRQCRDQAQADPVIVRLFESGLHEPISMLSMVRGSRGGNARVN